MSAAGKPMIRQPRRFHTILQANCAEVEEWLGSTMFHGHKDRIFYQSFVNWCYAAVRKAKHPNANFSDDQKLAIYVLTEYPTDSKKFIRLMDLYNSTYFTGGPKKGLLPIHISIDDVSINRGQKKLYEHIYSQDQRRAHAEATGNNLAYFDAAAKMRAARKEAKRAENLAAKAESLTMAGDDEEDEDENDEELQGWEEEVAIR